MDTVGECAVERGTKVVSGFGLDEGSFSVS